MDAKKISVRVKKVKKREINGLGREKSVKFRDRSTRGTVKLESRPPDAVNAKAGKCGVSGLFFMTATFSFSVQFEP
jgi:hypothetical protein